MRRRLWFIVALVALSVAATACNRGEDTPGTTVASVADNVANTAGSDAVATTARGVGDTTDSSVADGGTASDDDAEGADDEPTTVDGVPSYTVAETIETDDGDSLIVVVRPGTYSNVELENLVFDIVDRFEPLEAVVVDDPAAVALVTRDVLTEEEAEFLESHTFLRLTNGVDVTFHGPYGDVDGLIVGS